MVRYLVFTVAFSESHSIILEISRSLQTWSVYY